MRNGKEQSKWKWISCDERLPNSEETNRYLCTLRYGRDRYITILIFGYSYDHKDICWFDQDPVYGDHKYDNVVAWGYMPKPYGRRSK